MPKLFKILIPIYIFTLIVQIDLCTGICLGKLCFGAEKLADAMERKIEVKDLLKIRKIVGYDEEHESKNHSIWSRFLITVNLLNFARISENRQKQVFYKSLRLAQNEQDISTSLYISYEMQAFEQHLRNFSSLLKKNAFKLERVNQEMTTNQTNRDRLHLVQEKIKVLMRHGMRLLYGNLAAIKVQVANLAKSQVKSERKNIKNIIETHIDPLMLDIKNECKVIGCAISN